MKERSGLREARRARVQGAESFGFSTAHSHTRDERPRQGMMSQIEAPEAQVEFSENTSISDASITRVASLCASSPYPVVGHLLR